MSDNRPFAKWLWAFGSLTRQQVQISTIIHEIMADLEQLHELPSLQEAERNTLAQAMEQWKAIHLEVIDAYPSPDESEGDDANEAA